MMAENDVLQDAKRLAGQWRIAGPRLLLEPDRAPSDVPDQVAFRRVVEALLPGELDRLAEIVDEQAHEHDVPVDGSAIQRHHGIGQAHQLVRVLQQSADPCVVHGHRGRRHSESPHQLLVGEIDGGQRPHRRVLHGVQQFHHMRKHRLDVMLGRRQQLLHVGLCHIDGFDAVDLDLHLVVELLGTAFNPDESGAGQLGHAMLIERPHPGLHFAGRVSEQAFEKRLALSGRADLRIAEAVGPGHPLGVSE